ncbi:MAG: hypothetical protein U1G08_15225 [Verrucomicrobiota bacterium]
MNRSATWFLGPEVLLSALLAVIFGFCHRHGSGTGRDVDLAERFLMWLPFLAAPLAFSPLLLPSLRTWWGLGRILLALAVVLSVGSVKLIGAFGTGAKGQDAAFLMVLIFGTMLASVGTAVGGVVILAAERPAVHDWLRQHRLLGGFLTLLAAVPLGALMMLGTACGFGLIGGLWTSLRR